MKRYIQLLWLTLVMLFFTPLSYGASCSVHGESDFTISFRVTGSNTYQQFYLKQGSHGHVLWYTHQERVGSSYIFNEQNLEIGTSYDVRITSDASTNRLNYYRKKASSSDWQFIETKIQDLHNGNLSPVDGGTISNVSCGGGITTPPTYSNNAQFEFGTHICQSMPCSIPLTKNYTYTPLVFVMPTIDSSNPDADAPSTLYVSSNLDSNSTSFTINQRTKNISGSNFTPIAMTSVSYLVIEPGVASFGGHQVLAGYINSNAVASKSDSDSFSQVNFSSFGLNSFNADPVLLHQIQTNNNADKWMTSGRVLQSSSTARRQSAQLFLELSASLVSGYSYKQEKIAFLATLPTSANIAVDNNLVQFSNTFRTPSQSLPEPMQDGCDSYATTSLSSLSGVVAKKQERAGGHGGWLRRCSIQNNEVSFVVDEDFSDRSHIREYVGYFAFEQQRPSIDLCQYFPQPAQSWKSGSELNIQNNGSSISGWSTDYVNAYLANGALKVGFDTISYHAGLSGACDVGSCTSGGLKAGTPNPISPSFTSTASLSIDQWNYASICDGNYCSYSNSGSNEVTITILKPLNTLTVNGYNTLSFKVVFNDVGGPYGTEVRSYNPGGKVETVLKANGRYAFRDITFSGTGGKFSFERGVVLYVVNSFVQNNTTIMNDLGGLKDMIIYGPTATFNFNTPTSDFAAQILGDSVTFSNPITLRGAVTTNRLTMSTGNIEIIGEGACLTPSSNYTLELVPSSDIALTCETLTPTVRVLDNGVLATNFSGSVTVLVDGIPQQLTPVNGVLEQTLSLTVNQTKTVAVEAYINGDQANTTVTGQYQFVPFKFAIDDQYVVASKPQSVEAQVMACDSGNVVDIGYNGTPVITSTLTQPLGGMGVLTYSPVFASGTSTSDLTFTDSGVVQVQLEDGNFDCTGVQGCPIEGSSTLKGQFVVNSRPWTFAICSGETPAWTMDGTSSSGTKFKLASERFNLHVKPIVWQSGGAVSGEIETSSYCNAAITQNFFASNAPSAVVEMSSALHSPMGGSTSVLLQGDNGLSKVHNSGSGSGTNQHYDFTQLYWDEVGSLKVMADAQTNYLGMDINLGYRNIGRFVPEKLVLASNSWTYATGHSGFAYMNQPIEHAFSVEAQNAADQVTQNYGLFDSAYVSTVSYFNVDNAHKEIVDRVKDYSTLTWQQPAWSLGALNVTLTQYEFVKKAIPPSPSPYTTEPDGPYTQGFGLWASTVVDGVDFENKELEVHDSGAIVKSGKAFSEQPDFRYGRMRLQDVGGFTGNQIEVPLTTEYWNGSQFLTNGDDSGSDFDGSQFCRQLIWHSQAQTSSNASLSGSGTVSVGRSDRLSAQQSTTDTDNQIREQVRFWLRVSDTTLQKVATTDNDIQCNGSGARPWLRFNWRNLGDEDPNAVVTFGINRGNDRVIYKGESGLTGQ
ncbi:DUF6701 domain-containing protein [Vibrio vulnificus]|uniref:DUF6701 domain-containing protein n=1 Tax=Vibrio vulnificus TaxID=672 RepID=UPI0032ED78E4